jgi:putative membrane protein
MLLKKNIPPSYILGKIKLELALITLYSGAVTFLYHNYNISGWSVPISIPMIMGIVISLLLAFRSNQAYDRWWEARTIWGAIVNDSRTLARQVNTFVEHDYSINEIPNEEVFFFKERMIKRQIAWNYALSNHLRNHDAVAGIEKHLNRKDLKHIKNYNNIPMALLELHGYDLKMALRNGWINSFQHVEMDETLSRLCESMGKCERIKNTVFPATYSLYIHFSLFIFFMLMPFAMIEYISYLTVPAMITIAAVFFLVEKMAIHLQDPFENRPTDTPMTTISFTIERDLKQMINEQPAKEQASPVVAGNTKVFYVL